MSTHHHHAPAVVGQRRLLVGVVLGTLAVALVGLVLLWPRGPVPDVVRVGSGLDVVEATVRSVTEVQCTSVDEALATVCQRAEVELRSGPDRGSLATVDVPEIDFRVPDLVPGDELLLLDNPLAPPEFRYAFFDFQRSTPVLVLVALFAAVVLVVGRWHGLRALAGLAASLGVLAWFLLPALLRDQSPIAVALVACVLIAFAALYLTHGVNLVTTIALAGTLASLAVTTVLAMVFVVASRLTGLGDADAQVLRVTAEALDPQGLLIAGIVIGALGVLDDVTVTQVSAVAELRVALPDAPRRDLYRRGMRIGRDHVGSVVNTLVLAYAGASLYLLLFFVQYDEPIGRSLGRELVATEIVRTLVGGTGLVLAVPITTALAVALLTPETARRDRRAAEALGDDDEPGPARWEDFAPGS
jgi:uncharacterized membrane protein